MIRRKGLALGLMLIGSWTSMAETLRIVHFFEEGPGPFYGLMSVCDAYGNMMEKDDVTFQFESLSMEEHAEGFSSLLTGPNPPDLVQCFSNQAIDYGARLGQVMRLTAYLDRENRYDPERPWVDLFEAGLLEQSRDSVFGDVWSIPFALATERILVNLSLLERCGLSLPENWSSMIHCHQVLLEQGHTPCVMVGCPGFGPSEWALVTLQSMIWQNRVEEWDKLDRNGRVDRVEMVAAILRGDISLEDSQILEPLRLLHTWARFWQEDFEQETMESGLERFLQGQTGFFPNIMTQWNRIHARVDGAFVIAAIPMPRLDKADSIYAEGRYYEPAISPGLVLAVPASLEGQRDRLIRIMDFLQFLSSQRGQEIMVSTAGLLPATSGVQIPSELDGFRRRISGEYPIPNPFTLFAGSKERWLSEGVRDRIFRGEWDPSAIHEEWSPILQRQAQLFIPQEIQILHRQLAYHRGAYALMEMRHRVVQSAEDEVLSALIENTMRRSWWRLEQKQDLLGYLKELQGKYP